MQQRERGGGRHGGAGHGAQLPAAQAPRHAAVRRAALSAGALYLSVVGHAFDAVRPNVTNIVNITTAFKRFSFAANLTKVK